ncbi:MAG: PA2778 family cysteine peptidase [Gammaproteobacteria bacterium]|nr:PA2778 family cysteine peptidase [Gammaproteobacteria bacterium]
MRLPAVALTLALAACATGPSIRQASPPLDFVELAATPFFAQERHQCGPAALAMVLAADGADVTPDRLVDAVYLPEREGSVQAELIAAARRHGRVPYVLQPQLADLLREVAAGNPVLVLQNLGLGAWPLWHYAVAIGYDAQSDTVLLRSGTEKRKVSRATDFRRSWGLAGNWAMVVTPPQRLPATAQAGRWLEAAGAFEQLGQAPLAAAAYAAAAARWPDQALAWQLLGNARYAQQDLPGAAEALRHALRIEPSAAAHNNLAHVLLERGCRLQAQQEIERASALPAPEAQRAAIARTRAAIENYAGPVRADWGR